MTDIIRVAVAKLANPRAFTTFPLKRFPSKDFIKSYQPHKQFNFELNWPLPQFENPSFVTLEIKRVYKCLIESFYCNNPRHIPPGPHQI